MVKHTLFNHEFVGDEIHFTDIDAKAYYNEKENCIMIKATSKKKIEEANRRLELLLEDFRIYKEMEKEMKKEKNKSNGI
jgi:hypothetical protein